MAKPKQPLFSLGAHGTVADSVTYQKGQGTKIAREKPIPAQPRSLAQVYQRWLYQDYIYHWNQLTATQKAYWRAQASGKSITPLGAFMKDRLTHLPDITGLYHLDYISGTSTIDSSRNERHGTVFGAITADGQIDKGLWFDGIDDRVRCPTIPIADLDIGSVEFFAKADPTQALFAQYINLYFDGSNRLGIYATGAGAQLEVFGYIGAVVIFDLLSPTLLDDLWHHFGLTWDDTQAVMRVDKNIVSSAAGDKRLNFPGDPTLWFATYIGASNWYKGSLDEVILYNRALAGTEIQRHSERRYPL